MQQTEFLLLIVVSYSDRKQITELSKCFGVPKHVE